MDEILDALVSGRQILKFESFEERVGSITKSFEHFLHFAFPFHGVGFVRMPLWESRGKSSVEFIRSFFEFTTVDVV